MTVMAVVIFVQHSLVSKSLLRGEENDCQWETGSER